MLAAVVDDVHDDDDDDEASGCKPSLPAAIVVVAICRREKRVDFGTDLRLAEKVRLIVIAAAGCAPPSSFPPTPSEQHVRRLRSLKQTTATATKVSQNSKQKQQTNTIMWPLLAAANRNLLVIKLVSLLALIAAVAADDTNISRSGSKSVKRQDNNHDCASSTSSSSSDALVAGFLFAEVASSSTERTTDTQQQQQQREQHAATTVASNATLQRHIDDELDRLLQTQGPDMRPMRDFRSKNSVVDDDISVAVAERAWRRMRSHARSIVERRIMALGPLIERALQAARVSQQCTQAAQRTLAAAQRLDSWAIQLLSAWGTFPPTGLFEGTFGDIGSYHGCLSVPANSQVQHAHFCTLAFKPVLPTRADYELVVRPLPDALLHIFDRRNVTVDLSGDEDAFTELLKHAQYSHYIYYKLGACFPIECGPRDVQKLAREMAARSSLQSGPVKCHSQHAHDYANNDNKGDKTDTTALQISTRDLNDGIYIWKPHTSRTQLVALCVLGAISATIAALTLLDLCVNRAPRFFARLSRPDSAIKHAHSPEATRTVDMMEMKRAQTSPLQQVQQQATTDIATTTIRRLARDCSIITNASEFLGAQAGKRDITCINGIRCITMTWIIVAHTMQYNDWSAFARTREVETHLKSLVNQPLFNATYLVDTFFLVSGLLTSFSAFTSRARFSCWRQLWARYLRLTPQVVFVSLLFIVLPLLGGARGGPHWYTMTGEYAENCADNWWVNVLHIQAFYKQAQMCNFVGWWISVDMFYHLLALCVLVVAMRAGRSSVLPACLAMAGAHALVQSTRHYQLRLPPNLLSTIPQTGAMWTEMTLKIFWTPYAHAFPYFMGFYVGHLISSSGGGGSSASGSSSAHAKWFTRRRALVGWLMCACALVCTSYSTYFWVIGQWRYTRLQSTLFYVCAPLVWSACIAWTIIACHSGYGGCLNRLLSCALFRVLGRASYLVYLSHFLVLFTFFGSQNLLLEPTQLMMTYIILGNICLSMLLGSALCVVYEMPWLKAQRALVGGGGGGGGCNSDATKQQRCFVATRC